MTYPDYANLKLDWPAERVLRITLSRGSANALDMQMHRDLADIWRIIDNDRDVNAVILTGAGKFFSGGGDFFDLEPKIVADAEFRAMMWKDAKDLVRNIIECNKPIVSAINGPAAGGGAVGAILADVSIMARSAKIVDGHTRLGVAAGDHAAIIWPLLCGMAKAKYYLMTCKPIYGEEAERIGLVSMVVDDDKLEETSIEVATELARGSPSAVRWTKYAMNNWLRQAWPLFDTSLALETLGFTGRDVREAIASHQEKRDPNFDPDSHV
ncbi:MAG: enoyl-CoA hydratase/isomerase family protein [Sagittula sp.]|uniref:enoyl-CoA hydratase/isomerase family protein n=1 Tax=Sagittula sp. TaxID=2038081 RepID=UPI004059A027